MAAGELAQGRDRESETGQTEAQNRADEHDLRVGLAGLAELVAGSRPLEDVLTQIAQFAVRAVPGVDGAGVTLLNTPNKATGVSDEALRVQTWAVTAPFVREIDQVQYEVLGEGPCITAMESRHSVVSGALGEDHRWPRFGPRIAASGVHSTLSLPLILPGEPGQVVGAINSYSHQKQAFDEHAVDLGMQFAGPAAVSVHNTRLLTNARLLADQFRSALNSRAIIDQAIGVLRSRSGVTEEEAMARLRQLSQHENIKLATLAQRILDEAVRRAQARHTTD